jgi:hypothetical protein
MQAKKRVKAGAEVQSDESKPTQRPAGMQAMGPTIYEQIRRALIELEMKLVPEN